MQGAAIVIGTVATVFLLVIGVNIGWAEAAVFFVGSVFISSMLWYPPHVMRIVGAVLLRVGRCNNVEGGPGF